METPGEWIKRVREAARLTQDELTELLDVHENTVSKWENGAQNPEFRTLVAVAAFCGVPAPMGYNRKYFELLGRSPVREIPAPRRPAGMRRPYDPQMVKCLELLEKLVSSHTHLAAELDELKRLYPPPVEPWQEDP